MTTVKFGLSTTFPCGYLKDQQEQLLVYIDEQPLSPFMYSALQNQGFRRSEDQVYKPHCPNCNACQSIRISPYAVKLSTSQKRVANKGKVFNLKTSSSVKPIYYPLFEHYVNVKHPEGVCTRQMRNNLEVLLIVAGWNNCFLSFMMVTN